MARLLKVSQRSRVSLDPLRLSLLYLFIGITWVMFSDVLAEIFFSANPEVLSKFFSIKDIGFVCITSFVLFVVLQYHVAAYRRKELELLQSEERYRLVVENAPDAILIHDGLHFTFANPEAAKLFGASLPGQVVGKEIVNFVHDVSKASVLERIHTTIDSRAPVCLREQKYLRLDGTSIEVEVSAVPFIEGKSPSALVFMRDIGSRKEIERNLQKNEAKYRLLAENAYDVIFTINNNLELTYISPSVRKVLGFTVEEVLGKSLYDFIMPNSLAVFLEKIKILNEIEKIDKGFVDRVSVELKCKNGGSVWVESVVRPLFDAEDHFCGFTGVSRDISERRRVEEELEISRQFMAMILNAIPDPVFVKDHTHRFVLANDALCSLLGHPPGSMIGKTDEAFVTREENAIFIERDNLVLETGCEDLNEERLTDQEGQIHVLVTRKGLFVDPKGQSFIVGVIRDVTEGKAQEQRLRDSLVEKEVLLKEVHHRVKNNLQVISSLLFLQKEGIEDPIIQDLFEESRSRISSMALVHEELYRSGDLARVDLKEYLERLTPKVMQSLRGQRNLNFVLQLTECRVAVDKAIPFGLIINELMTNAIKHGFQSRSAGNLQVSMTREDNLIRTVVEDDGVGLPDGFHPDAVKSLGMQLVVQLTRQLRGTLTFGSGPQGTVFRLVFPLDGV